MFNMLNVISYIVYS